MPHNNRPAKVALVTGAAGALGSAISQALARQGFAIAAVDISLEGARQLAGQLGREHADCFAYRADVSSETDILALMEQIAKQYGRLDCVVNNAAINKREHISQITEQNWSRIMAVNVLGPALLVKHAYPYFKQQNFGRVINIASRSWLAGGAVAYATSKTALVGFTKAIARQLAPVNATANAIAPGLLATDFTTEGRPDEFAIQEKAYKAITPLKRLAVPADVAGVAAMLASDAASYLTGEIINVAGGSQLAGFISPQDLEDLMRAGQPQPQPPLSF